MNKTKHPENSILVLLRICTCLLAAVSFWATAQGMIDYTFPEDWQAYAASLGIQGLLLGLNFSLPSFLKQCNGRGAARCPNVPDSSHPILLLMVQLLVHRRAGLWRFLDHRVPFVGPVYL